MFPLENKMSKEIKYLMATNEFTDNNDAIGLFATEPEAKQFLSIEETDKI